MGLRQIGIYFCCSTCCGSRAREALPRRQHAVNAHHGVAVREADIPFRIQRVSGDSLLKACCCLLQRFYRTLIPKISSLEIHSVCLGLFGVPLCELLLVFAGESEAKLVHDLGRDFVLNREYVSYFAAELIAPELEATRHI